MSLPKPPAITWLTSQKTNSGPGFLKLVRRRSQFRTPAGQWSSEFEWDFIERRGLGAVCVVVYEERNGVGGIWLRSCVRPGLGELGNTWELPAGLVDSGESLEAAAIRELREETGFEVLESDLVALGPGMFSAPGVIGERIWFYGVLVTGKSRGLPLEDGSPLEAGGEVCWVSLAEFWSAWRTGEILDAKTELGVRRWEAECG